jgi:hypothetical protein
VCCPACSYMARGKHSSLIFNIKSWNDASYREYDYFCHEFIV